MVPARECGSIDYSPHAVIAVGGMKVSDTLQQKLPTDGAVADGGAKGKGKLLGFSVVDRKETK